MRLKTFIVETHLLLLYRVVAYVRIVGGQQIHIYFHKIKPMVLRLQTKDAHNVDESISIGCVQKDPTYFRYFLLSTSDLRASCAYV